MNIFMYPNELSFIHPPKFLGIHDRKIFFIEFGIKNSLWMWVEHNVLALVCIKIDFSCGIFACVDWI